MPFRSGDARYGDGNPIADIRLGQQGEQLGSDLHGSYYEQSVRRNLFFSYSAARATSLATATAQIGNIIWNPPDSGVNLSFNKWSSSIVVTTAALHSIVLSVGYQTTTPTSVTVADASGSCYLTVSGATNAVFRQGRAKAYAIATVLIAPLPVWYLHHSTVAIAATGQDTQTGDLKGGIVVPPGGFLTVNSIGAAVAASGHYSSFWWEEVPLIT